MARTAFLALAGLLLVPPASAPAHTWHITPDGLGDSPTIQGGIDLCAPGDTVSLGCGTFVEANLQVPVDLTLRSDVGDPACVTIQGDYQEPVLHLLSVSCVLEGLTIANGQGAAGGVYAQNSDIRVTDCVLRDHHSRAMGLAGGTANVERCVFRDNTPEGGVEVSLFGAGTFTDCQFLRNEADAGGALYCGYPAPVSLTGCLFEENVASRGGAIQSAHQIDVTNCRFARNTAYRGGAIRLVASSSATSTVSHSTFLGNSAESVSSLYYGGGAIYADGSTLTIDQCTFFGNTATERGAVLYCIGSPAPTVSRSILAFNLQGPATFCFLDAAVPQFDCCDLHGNELGDWSGCIADQDGVNGNFSADPLFCDPVGEDLRLQNGSPCLPPDSPPGCGVLGPLGACGSMSAAANLESTTWALIKERYR